jgi:predicted RNase H-like nuclease (RuvC/YqgF family)
VDLTEVMVVVVSTAGTILGSSAVWKFWEARAKEKQRTADLDRKDENLYRDDLRERVAVLESKLERAELEKNDLQREMIRLVEKIAALSVEVEFLRKENSDLRTELGHKANS